MKSNIAIAALLLLAGCAAPTATHVECRTGTTVFVVDTLTTRVTAICLPIGKPGGVVVQPDGTIAATVQ